MTPFEIELAKAILQGAPKLEASEQHHARRRESSRLLSQQGELYDKGFSQASAQLSAIRQQVLTAAKNGRYSVWISFGWEYTWLIVRFKKFQASYYAEGFTEALWQGLKFEAARLCLQETNVGITIDFSDYLYTEGPRAQTIIGIGNIAEVIT